MRERGRYQIQLMKTRSSSGVGQKIDLEFDIETLKINDIGETDTDSSGSTSIYNSLKMQSKVVHDSMDNEKNITADVQSTKLKDLLNKIKPS
jgi:hypothetical protein